MPHPHTPGGDLTLLLVPTPGAIGTCPIIGPIFIISNKIALRVAPAVILLATSVRLLRQLVNPLGGGDFLANSAPGVGNLTPIIVKSPVFPHPPWGAWRVGHEIDKCILGQ